jgi:hypothetical protein
MAKNFIPKAMKERVPHLRPLQESPYWWNRARKKWGNMAPELSV